MIEIGKAAYGAYDLSGSRPPAVLQTGRMPIGCSRYRHIVRRKGSASSTSSNALLQPQRADRRQLRVCRSLRSHRLETQFGWDVEYFCVGRYRMR